MAYKLATLLSLAVATLAVPTTTPPVDAKSCPSAQKFLKGYHNDALPDPFTFNDGTPVVTRAEWDCRRKQISTFLQSYELGTIPDKPPHLSHTFDHTNTSRPANLTITAGKGSKQISWSVSISYPNATYGEGPFPAVIVYDGLSIPVPAGVATITFAVSSFAQQNSAASRGIGTFYDLYGANATGSAMVAWTWGVSRIIDVLEHDPKIKIKAGKLAVTGCSRNGKGALVAGAFEDRIALTIAQESGSGGDTCWRLSKYEQDSGDVVQQATEIVGENVWFSEEFANWVYNISSLPYDHHMLMGMVAPRALYDTSNTAYEWLSPVSAYGCGTAAQKIYDALGVSGSHSTQQDGNHTHCGFPADQVPSLNAFFAQFLLDQPADTNYGVVTNGPGAAWNNTPFDEAQWIPWSTPTLV